MESEGRPRALHVATSAISLGLMRGQPSFLRDAGFEVTVVSSPGRALDAMGRDEGVHVHAVPMKREISWISDLVSLWKLWRMMRRQRPAITNVSTPKAGLLGGLASYLSRVPCRVYTLRGLRCESTRGLKRWSLLLAEWVACRCAHRVICVSESLLQKALTLGIVDSRRAIVLGSGSSNGVNPDHFALTTERLRQAAALRRDLEIPEGAPVVGFAGRFTRDKGLSELVSAYCRLRSEHSDIRLLLVGDFEDGDPVPKSIREVIQSDPQIICTGTVDDAAAYYHVMDVLALPSYREGFPNVVLEAHAAGKAVVATRATGIVDAVRDGVTGALVPVGDPEALASILSILLANPSLAKKMGQAGRERVLQEFRHEIIWKLLEQEYFRLLQEKGLPLPGGETNAVQTLNSAVSISSQ